MSDESRPRVFTFDEARVQVFESVDDLARAAARDSAKVIAQATGERGRARVVAATGNSQLAFVSALTQQPIEWQKVELFHMDEYVGISSSHPASFRRWIHDRLEAVVDSRVTHYLHGDAPDLDAEVARFSNLLLEAPIDVAFVGFGENGHIAFNDPPVADFSDPAAVKRVSLDEACRRQQTGEGHFKTPEDVPREALTVTCTGLFRARNWICVVPESRKAEAVRNALQGEISERCPASLARRHPNTYVYLDRDSASLLEKP